MGVQNLLAFKNRNRNCTPLRFHRPFRKLCGLSSADSSCFALAASFLYYAVLGRTPEAELQELGEDGKIDKNQWAAEVHLPKQLPRSLCLFRGQPKQKQKSQSCSHLAS